MQDVTFKVIWIIYTVITMRYEDAVVIILTALGVMLAILGIGIALLALLGYGEIKKFLQSTIEKRVEARVIEIRQSIKDELVTALKPNLVAISPPGDVQKNVSGVLPYPEELPDANRVEPGDSESGPNNS